MIVFQSVFDAQNDGEVRFILRPAVVEILYIQLLSKIEQVPAMPSSSTTTQQRVKRTSPSFSASKTEQETITKTSVLQSSKNQKMRGNGENYTLFSLFEFFLVFRRPLPGLGMNTLSICFLWNFERGMWHFN